MSMGMLKVQEKLSVVKGILSKKFRDLLIISKDSAYGLLWQLHVIFFISIFPTKYKNSFWAECFLACRH